jgi:hypothetical protein
LELIDATDAIDVHVYITLEDTIPNMDEASSVKPSKQPKNKLKKATDFVIKHTLPKKEKREKNEKKEENREEKWVEPKTEGDIHKVARKDNNCGEMQVDFAAEKRTLSSEFRNQAVLGDWYLDDDEVLNFDRFLRFVVLKHFLENYEEFKVVFDNHRMLFCSEFIC